MRSGIHSRRKEFFKSVKVRTWHNFDNVFAMCATLFLLFVQFALLVVFYALFAVRFVIVLFVAFGFTFLTCLYIFFNEKDSQCRASWLILMLLSFGFGFIIYILANKKICFCGYTRRLRAIYKRNAVPPRTDLIICSDAVKNDCEYAYRTGGFVPYANTSARYFSSGKTFFDNAIARIEKAEKFVFIEFFIIADGVLLERLISVLRRKIAEGVEVKLIYDDLGCLSLFSSITKRRLKDIGVQMKAFSRILTVFNFGLNFRDHRKIIVVDGKTCYVGGCNIADECVNQHRMEGVWKDAGIRLDGEAVDGVTSIFLNQWELLSRRQPDRLKYTGQYEKVSSQSVFLPYAGGPELNESLCRGIYANAVAGAREKLYIMSPYFVPDGDLLEQVRHKALSGVDVRIVIPEVADRKFIYKVTKANAEALIKCGVKLYIGKGMFVHSKLILTENCATIGSVNFDMRAFYQEFDNGIYTDDPEIMREVENDFLSIFMQGAPVAEESKRGFFSRAELAFLKLLSPLM